MFPVWGIDGELTKVMVNVACHGWELQLADQPGALATLCAYSITGWIFGLKVAEVTG